MTGVTSVTEKTKNQVERVFHLYSKDEQNTVNKGWGHTLKDAKKTDF